MSKTWDYDAPMYYDFADKVDIERVVSPGTSDWFRKPHPLHEVKNSKKPKEMIDFNAQRQMQDNFTDMKPAIHTPIIERPILKKSKESAHRLQKSSKKELVKAIIEHKESPRFIYDSPLRNLKASPKRIKQEETFGENSSANANENVNQSGSSENNEELNLMRKRRANSNQTDDSAKSERRRALQERLRKRLEEKRGSNGASVARTSSSSIMRKRAKMRRQVSVKDVKAAQKEVEAVTTQHLSTPTAAPGDSKVKSLPPNNGARVSKAPPHRPGQATIPSLSNISPNPESLWGGQTGMGRRQKGIANKLWTKIKMNGTRGVNEGANADSQRTRIQGNVNFTLASSTKSRVPVTGRTRNRRV